MPPASDHHHQPVLIRFFLVFEGGRMHLIPSAIAPTPSLHLAKRNSSELRENKLRENKKINSAKINKASVVPFPGI